MDFRFVDYLLEGSFGVLEESFKDYAKKHPGSEKLIKRFKELNARKAIKPPYHDISHWMNKETEELKSFLDGIKLEKTRKEIKKEAIKNKVAENDEYIVVRIDNHDEVYALGKGTVWCIASGEKERAFGLYNYYTQDSSFYVAYKKQLGEPKMLPTAHGAVEGGKDEAMIYPYWDKVAIQCKYDGSFIYWNTGDYDHKDGSEELSKVNLPKYDYKYIWQHPSNFTKNSDGSYDVDGDIEIINSMLVNGKFQLKFGNVSGNFKCSDSPDLTSLEGAPTSVGGNFNCSDCNNLKSLVGAPTSVGGYFGCAGCEKLESLEGAPKSVVKDFNCYSCNSLTSLEGAPTSVGGNFNCSDCNNLKSLVGAPTSVGGYFSCSSCEKLESLDGAPESVEYNFYCTECPKLKLSELDKLPESYRDRVQHDLKESAFYYWDKKYQSLKG